VQCPSVSGLRFDLQGIGTGAHFLGGFRANRLGSSCSTPAAMHAAQLVLYYTYIMGRISSTCPRLLKFYSYIDTYLVDFHIETRSHHSCVISEALKDSEKGHISTDYHISRYTYNLSCFGRTPNENTG